MAVASLLIRIGADIADFEKKIAGVERTLQKSGRNLESIGERMTKGLTLPLVGAAGVATKAAIDFESSFAGIRKTVNATEEQFAGLSSGMRDLAKTIPVNVNELNKIGEAAGQLGIKTENILGFTKVIAQIGTATNLSTEQAATGFARLANITGLPQTQFSNLGSALVALGNNFATTESEILEFGLRIAGAGKLAKLQESDILAIGTALSSVGVEAEAGGTAVQKMLLAMVKAVETGGDQLTVFNQTVAHTGQSFRDLFKNNPAEAFTAFVEGLGKSGDKAITTLQALGLEEARLTRSFTSIAGAGDLLRRTIDTSSTAFRENTALAREAEQRYKTTASQLILLKNNLQDVAITFGQALLPALNDTVTSSKPLVSALESMAKTFAGLPTPIRNTTIAFLALIASLGPIVYIVGSVTKSWAALAAAIRYIPTAIGGASAAFLALVTGLTGVTTGVTGVTGALYLMRGAAIALIGSAGGLVGLFAGIALALPKAAEGVRNLAAAISERRFWEFVTTKDAPNIKERFQGWGQGAKEAAGHFDALGRSLSEIRGKKADVNLGIEVTNLKNQLTGADLPLKVAELAKAFNEMTPAQQRAADVMKRVGQSALQLKDAGAILTPELEKLAKAAIRIEKTDMGKALKVSASEARAMIRRIEDQARATVRLEKNTNALSLETKRFYDTVFSRNLGIATRQMDAYAESVLAVVRLQSETARNMRAGANDLSFVFSMPGTDIGLPVKPKDLVEPFRTAFTTFGNELPGIIFGALQGGGSIMGSVVAGLSVTLNKMTDQIRDRIKTNLENGVKDGFKGTEKIAATAGVALSSALAGFDFGKALGKGKGALGGAASGAMAGLPLAAFTGGLSVAVGALAGALGAWLGGAKKAREELAKLQEAQRDVVREFGGVDKLRAKADELGISIGNALTTKNAQVFKSTMEELSQAIDAQKTRMEGLGKAIEGVNARAEGLAAPFRELLKERGDIKLSTEESQESIDALNRKLAAMAQQGQGQFERLGTFVAATFAGITKETGDAVSAIGQLAPAFKVLQQGVSEFGFTTTGTIDQLISMFGQVNDTVTGPIHTSIQATGQIFAGLQQAGYMTSDLFHTVSADIGESFRELEAKGADVSKAMALSQPVLQKLWEGQEKYGAVTDETTKEILRQAREQGLVGNHMKDVNQKILDVLVAIADVFGAKLPDAFAIAGASAKTTAAEIQTSLGNIRPPRIRVPIEYDVPNLPRLAVDGGSVETDISVDQTASARPQTVNVHIDGRAVARTTVAHMPDVLDVYGVR